jgi:hypothetical protein
MGVVGINGHKTAPMPDRLREIANGIGVLKGLLSFLAFSAFVVCVGWLLGVFDHDPTDDGGVKIIYQPPMGERRY